MKKLTKPGYVNVNDELKKPSVWASDDNDFFANPKGFVKLHGKDAAMAEWDRLIRKGAPQKAQPAKQKGPYDNWLALIGLILVIEVVYMLVKFGTLIPQPYMIK